jgi:hypothetical protein
VVRQNEKSNTMHVLVEFWVGAIDSRAGVAMEVEGGGSDDVDLLSGWAGRSRPSNFDGLVRLESRAAV